MALNSNFNELATTTLNLWGSRQFANIFTGHNPLWYMLRKRQNIQQGGLGIKVLEPLQYYDTSGPQVEGVADPYSQLTPMDTTGWTNAEYAWCEKRLSVSIPELIMDQQGSETQRINYLNTVKDISMKKFMEALNTDLWAAEGAAGSDGSSRLTLGSLRTYLNRGGTATTNTSNSYVLTEQLYNANAQPGGAAVGTTPLTKVGNIERNVANGGLWCTPVANPASTDTLTIAKMNYLYNLAVRDTDHPDLIVMGRGNFGDFMAIYQGYQRFVGNDSGLADAGFESIRFRGADVIFDDKCPTLNIFAINTAYLKLRCASMAPQFKEKPDPHRTILNWNARWVGQISSGHLGRAHARHAKIGV